MIMSFLADARARYRQRIREYEREITIIEKRIERINMIEDEETP